MEGKPGTKVKVTSRNKEPAASCRKAEEAARRGKRPQSSFSKVSPCTRRNVVPIQVRKGITCIDTEQHLRVYANKRTTHACIRLRAWAVANFDSLPRIEAKIIALVDPN